MAALRSPIAVWLLLMLLTLLSYASWAEAALADGPIAGSAVIVIAFLKVRLIGHHFMDLREAILPLRIVFEAWAVIVCVLLLGMFWVAG